MSEYIDFAPGDGPMSGVSVTLPAGTLQTVGELGGVSGCLERAEQRQTEGDNLGELIAAFDEVHGPAEREAAAAKRAKLTGQVPEPGRP
ncbi:hypothetical protein ACFY2W_08305 [Streptomyces sp. NPDC001262]|uniref:hypothetical protein n=1 Tax=Streptomyces sp. NPDC001262 TaxID=3364552 RepID=UPI00368CF695